MTTLVPTRNEQQQAAIDAHGTVFVAAGAGTGKTAVLVERFVTAVVDDGLDVQSLLVITYTERAAGELRARIRGRLIERGRPDLALELDGAWVSTIHGFCRRLLGAYPLAAGVDPGFRVLDEPQALVLQAEAFGVALERFCAVDEPDRWQLLATYGAAGLRRMLVEVYATLRSAGRELVLEASGVRVLLAERIDALRDAAGGLLDDGRATEAQRGAASAALDLIAATALPERLLPLLDLKARGPRAAAFAEARDAVVATALEELATRDRELLQELLTAFADAYAEAKDAESALDFEDLQLRARDLLRDDVRIREREQERFRSLMVDEFQDTNRLQTELLDLLRRRSGRPRPLSRRRRVPVDLRLSSRRRRRLPRAPRGSADGAAPDAELPLAARGARGGERALRRRVRRRVPAARASRRTRPVRAPDGLRAAGHGQGSRRRDGCPLATVRGASRRTARPRARGRRRCEPRRDRPPLRRRHRRGVVRGGAPGRRPPDLPRRRPELLGQQQVVDLLAYLRLLHNRYDDEALLTVLASPFVGARTTRSS